MDTKIVVPLVVLFFVLNTTITSMMAFSQAEEHGPCSLTYFDPHCSPSGWMSFILGDIVIAIALGVFLHHLSSKNHKRLVRNSERIDAILKRSEESKRRLLVFNSQMLKNDFSVILMNMGLMNMALNKAKVYEDIPLNIRENYASLQSVLNSTHNTIKSSLDVLDPLFISEIQGFVTHFEGIKPANGVGEGFPEYEKIKSDITHITDKLDKVVGTGEVLK
ncbi:MAG: hypothetical protein F4W68_00075 [Cenarchaeum sp. SB0661_bin_35]|nr:hypothetical protein [Cenarchaeum sp. SB0666_bin_15]MYB47116.1 hypothetical protein [Cenarchaeum sp. SB0662_bin_33]MYC78900.1 hypothetical protein [Cenarchaeum sp. SB0661_bin_35]MYG33089.1 hypothetical protein [Cenarchaeum sp. SB0677_bin_16]